ncbi:SPASM domain-containing protein [Nisaea sp.]|uniref:SPASM domain-containing protein n=1 Tax=Nisaea sp. TaxID=2024842 RepID=UPI003B51570D
MKPTKFPVHIDIDLSTKCNLRCSFCHLSYFKPKSWTQISAEQFTTIEPLLPHLKSMTLFSKYEVLTCRDFIPIFEKIAAYDIETYFSTNGILLDDDVIDVLVGKLTFLTVSVTGFDRTSYERHMGLDRLEVVRERLARLNEKKRARNTDLPRLRISTVGMLSTLDDLPKAVDFAHEFEASEGVQVTYLKAHGDNMVREMPLNDPEAFQDACDVARAHADELGVPFEQQGGTITEIVEATKELGHRFCSMPWHRLSIQPDGEVYPCPLSAKPIGNLNEQTIDEIWNGERLATFRSKVNVVEDQNEDCRNCTHCRHRNVLDPAANDFSSAQSYVAGMTRIGSE